VWDIFEKVGFKTRGDATLRGLEVLIAKDELR